MKIAWVVEGPMWTSSAYTQQINLFSDFLHNFGHESAIANVASFKDQGDELMDSLIKYSPDVLVAFGDSHPWGMAEYLGIPMLSWFLWGSTQPLPITEPFPLVIFACPSRAVQDRFEDSGMSSVYLPHAFDPNVFHPGRRASARARLDWIEDRPTVLMVSTNMAQGEHEPGPDRKNWAGSLDAFSDVLEKHPDAILYAHATDTGALDIKEYAQTLGIADSVQVADQSRMSGDRDFDSNYMADLYRASNVLLYASLAEGFGIPLIEAQACGIPVVTTNAPPMKELTLTGSAVTAQPHPDMPGWMLPRRTDIGYALANWMNAPAPFSSPGDISDKIQGFAVEAVVEDRFLPALEAAVALRPKTRPSYRSRTPEPGPLKLDIGSGGEQFERMDESWITVDKYAPADVTADMWELPYADGSVEEIFSSHALEHVPSGRVQPTLKEWHRVLKSGGQCTIQVPDLDYVAHYWLEGENRDIALGMVFGSQANEGEFHKTGWNLETLRLDCEAAGFGIKEAQVLWTKDYTQDSIRIVATKP